MNNLVQQKMSDEEYDNAIAKLHGFDSPAKLAASEVFKTALKTNGGDPARAIRSLESKRETFNQLEGWFVASVPEWNFTGKELTGKFNVSVLLKDGAIINRKLPAGAHERWNPLKTMLKVGPVVRTTTYLGKVTLEYKNATFVEAAHEAPLPEVTKPGLAEAINIASAFKTKGRKVLRLKANDVHVMGTISDDPTQIRYKEAGGEFPESLQVVVESDGYRAQINFKANAVFSPDHIAKVFGCDKSEDGFRDRLPRAAFFARGQLGLTMPWDPLKGDDAVDPSTLAAYIEKFREEGYLIKETNKNTGEVTERLSFNGKFELDENGQPVLDEKGQKKPQKSIIFCGREIVDIEQSFDEQGNESWKPAVLMTSQPGKYPWLSVNPSEVRESGQPGQNHGAFIIFPEHQLEGVEVTRDDAATAAAARWAKFTGA